MAAPFNVFDVLANAVLGVCAVLCCFAVYFASLILQGMLNAYQAPVQFYVFLALLLVLALTPFMAALIALRLRKSPRKPARRAMLGAVVMLPATIFWTLPGSGQLPETAAVAPVVAGLCIASVVGLFALAVLRAGES